ncbi:uncharacterized membrane protein YgaE (UPF0421/DUF939 family) [Saccharopolyspora lacisalsi]|uniref:Uncharacterized membrane protein YgaE (UPF0421/DUF939 family) n=1 Tax=Halosaccharopolyspora lacisalsi TaxID=1000566 RepID=A0A839E0N0_9PSEU|nr:FUSC family protein [Halosaccharopolyspora lacisalsi]MBA8825001.1 uncharacterized membrane protein YgaE (UPF0421/DUF939 family) [Halosaccharopolyspora lacisalsi]
MEDFRILLSEAVQRVRLIALRAVLAAVTAALAWWLAGIVLEQPYPIFAPITALVSLLDAPGTRGTRVFRLLGGVMVGVAVGEVLLRYVGASAWELGAAAGIAVLLVATFSMNPLTVIQAGIAALLVVATHIPETGFDRLLSALLGGALALVVSQVLVSPSPSGMLGGAARTTLFSAARGLRGAARALDEADPDAAHAALRIVRVGFQDLAAFQTSRDTSDQVARRTVRGRRERRFVHRLDARLAHLDSFYTGTLLVTRAAHEIAEQRSVVPAWLLGAITDLAHAVEVLSADPLSETRRRRAHALAGPLRQLSSTELTHPLTTLVTEVRLAAADLAELTRGEESD